MVGNGEKTGKYKELHEMVLFTVIRITRKDQVYKWSHKFRFKKCNFLEEQYLS